VTCGVAAIHVVDSLKQSSSNHHQHPSLFAMLTRIAAILRVVMLSSADDVVQQMPTELTKYL
jgi:hypothetical protein